MSDDRFRDPPPDRFHVDRNQPVTGYEMHVWLENFARDFGIKRPAPVVVVAPMNKAPEPLPSEPESEDES
jgi:hypothetical protein